MDGNRRWAKERGLPVLAGHKKVADDILIPLVEHAADAGISYMTFWAFSTENWQRDTEEVSGIMEIFRHVIKKRWQRPHEKGVRIKVIGDLSKFSDDIRDSMIAVQEQTKNNTKITAVFAINYGGRDELLRAIDKAISYQLSAIRQKKQNVVSEDWRLTTDDFHFTVNINLKKSVPMRASFSKSAVLSVPSIVANTYIPSLIFFMGNASVRFPQTATLVTTAPAFTNNFSRSIFFF